MKRMLINAIDAEESRIAVVENGVLQELHVEIASRTAYLGNIYKAKVVNIEPSIGAAFVNFGGGSNGFLHASDILPASTALPMVSSTSAAADAARDDATHRAPLAPRE